MSYLKRYFSKEKILPEENTAKLRNDKNLITFYSKL